MSDDGLRLVHSWYWPNLAKSKIHIHNTASVRTKARFLFSGRLQCRYFYRAARLLRHIYIYILRERERDRERQRDRETERKRGREGERGRVYGLNAMPVG